MKHHVCLLITRGDSIGGAQIHVRDIAFRLKNDGYKVTVITGTTGDFTEQLTAGKVSWIEAPQLIRSISPIKDLKAVLTLVSLLRKIKPDLLSCHTAKAGMVGRLAGFLSGIPTLFTAHGWQFADGIPSSQARAVLIIEKIVSRLCRNVITVSDYDFRLALRKKAVAKKKLVTIHNGLPWLEANPEEQSGLNADKPCRLIMVARFQEQKDHALLLDALAELMHLNWALELVGGGHLAEAVKARAAELGILPRVSFPGQQGDVPSRLAKADVFSLITHWEGFPRSIVEAMRAGLPVIVSDVGGCGESVIDGETGFLIPRGDKSLLTEQLSRLIEDPVLRRQMGRAGRVRYEKYFTFDIMYEKTMDLYKQIWS